jgi:hypothetical protein
VFSRRLSVERTTSATLGEVGGTTLSTMQGFGVLSAQKSSRDHKIPKTLSCLPLRRKQLTAHKNLLRSAGKVEDFDGLWLKPLLFFSGAGEKE